MIAIQLGEICHFEKGITGLAKATPGIYSLVTTGSERRTCDTYQFDTKAVCIPLVSSTGHGHASIKNVHYQEGKFALGSILVALTAKDENQLDIQYLHLYLSELKDQILVPLMSGAANVALSVSKIKNIKIPLPNIYRQRHIVQKFNKIKCEDEQLRNELLVQHSLLISLRERILQEAIKGKLSSDWRMKNNEVEPSIKLLERITVEKSRLNINKKNELLLPIHEQDIPFMLPNTWAWARMGNITNYGGAKKIRPQEIPDDTWVLDLEDIQKDTSKIVNFEIAKTRKVNSDKCIFNEGDVLYSKLRPNLNKVVIAPRSGVCTTEIIPLHMFCDFNPYFFMLALKAKNFLAYAESKVKGMKMPRLGTNDAKNALIPIPPLQEQQIIVTKVKNLFSICDQLEKELENNKLHANQLMEVVLKEAFGNSYSVITESKSESTYA